MRITIWWKGIWKNVDCRYCKSNRRSTGPLLSLFSLKRSAVWQRDRAICKCFGRAIYGCPQRWYADFATGHWRHAAYSGRSEYKILFCLSRFWKQEVSWPALPESVWEDGPDGRKAASASAAKGGDPVWWLADNSKVLRLRSTRHPACRWSGTGRESKADSCVSTRCFTFVNRF